MSVKPENDAGVIALLRVMERETAMFRFSDSNEYISVVDSIQHDQTGSYDADIIDKVDTVEPFK